MQTPFVILGDGWQNPTGLARIARDLTAVLDDVAQPWYLGYHPPALAVIPGQTPRYVSFSHLGEDWGAETVVTWLLQQFPQTTLPGVLLVVWDPARAFFYSHLKQYLPGWQLWGYFAVDGHNVNGSIGSGAAHAIKTFDRVLAYTEYGMQIMRPIRGRSVSALPHGHTIETIPGLDLAVMQQLFPRWAKDDGWLIGCVATNQRRKDLHLFFSTIKELRQAGENVYGWLHTDTLVKGDGWDIPELVDQFGLQRWIRVTLPPLTDEQLRSCYQACTLTICVGRGEGFGYPIVESLACGTPVTGMDYAGGAELIPARWRYGWSGVDYSHNQYAIGRPLADQRSVLQAIDLIMDDVRNSNLSETMVYCAGSVAHLKWSALQARWESWVRQGLKEL